MKKLLFILLVSLAGLQSYSQVIVIGKETGSLYLNAGSDQTITTLDSILISASTRNIDSLVWSTSGTGTFTDATNKRTYYHPSEADYLLDSITLSIAGYALNGQDTLWSEVILTNNLYEYPSEFVTCYTVPGNVINTGLAYLPTSDVYLIGDFTNTAIIKTTRNNQYQGSIDLSGLMTLLQDITVDQSDTTIWAWGKSLDGESSRIYHFDTLGTTIYSDSITVPYTAGALDYDSITNYLLVRPSTGDLAYYVYRYNSNTKAKVDSFYLQGIGVGEGLFYDEKNNNYWIGKNESQDICRIYNASVSAGQTVVIDYYDNPSHHFSGDTVNGTAGEIGGLIIDPVTNMLVFNADQTYHGSIPNGNRFWVMDVFSERSNYLDIHDSLTNIFCSRLYDLPTLAERRNIDTLIATLVDAGIWDRLSGLVLPVFAREQQSMMNLKSYRYNLVGYNSPTYTTNSGIASNGSTSYYSTQFKAAQNINIDTYYKNSCFMAIYSATNNVGTVCDMGVFETGVAYSNIFFRMAADAHYSRINTTGAVYPSGTVASSTGLYALQRNSANQVVVYHNGDSIGTAASTSSAITDLEVFVGARNSNGKASLFTTRQYRGIAYGNKLTTAQHEILFNAIEDFLDKKSIGVIE